MTVPPVTVTPSLHTGLAYFVLSHLNLGRDAASLYISRPDAPAWVPALLEAYHAAPGRLGVHFAPLRVRDLIALFGWLERPPPEFHTPADRRLCEQLYIAIEAETVAFEARWADTCADEARCRELADALDGIAPVMTALWARRHEPPPRLVVHDAPALRGRGRGWTTPTYQLVATSLAEPLEHVVCQVLHEAIHPVSDRETQGQVSTPRDTRHGETGYDVHHGLEAHAVAVGKALVETHAPALIEGYHRWQVRVGMVNTDSSPHDH